MFRREGSPQEYRLERWFPLTGSQIRNMILRAVSCPGYQCFEVWHFNLPASRAVEAQDSFSKCGEQSCVSMANRVGDPDLSSFQAGLPRHS